MVKPAYALVVTPHPDDAEYGIAGTVARWVKEGKDVVYVVCTNGDKGSSDVNMKPEERQAVLEMANVAGRPLAIHAGVPVCQIVLQRCEGEAVYAGRFKVQESL